MEARLILGEPNIIFRMNNRCMAAPAIWRKTAGNEGWTPKGELRPLAEDLVERAKKLPKQQQKFNLQLLAHRLHGLQCRLEEAGWEGDVVFAYMAIGIALKNGQGFKTVRGIMEGRKDGRQWLDAARKVSPEAMEYLLDTPMCMLSGVRQRAWLRIKEWTDEFLREEEHPPVLEYYSTPEGKTIGIKPEEVEERVEFGWRHISTITFDDEGEVVGCLCMGNPKDCPKYLKRGCRIHEIH